MLDMRKSTRWSLGRDMTSTPTAVFLLSWRQVRVKAPSYAQVCELEAITVNGVDSTSDAAFKSACDLGVFTTPDGLREVGNRLSSKTKHGCLDAVWSRRLSRSRLVAPRASGFAGFIRRRNILENSRVFFSVPVHQRAGVLRPARVLLLLYSGIHMPKVSVFSDAPPRGKPRRLNQPSSKGGRMAACGSDRRAPANIQQPKAFNSKQSLYPWMVGALAIIVTKECGIRDPLI